MITTEDRSIAVEDAAGLPLTAALGIGATWRSRWYARSSVFPSVIVSFYGEQALAASGLSVEVSYDNSGTVHNEYLASSAPKTLNGAARHVVDLEARLMSPQYRIKVLNGPAIQAGAKLWMVAKTP